MSSPTQSDNTCYRHPDRQSFILCQRCGRTICPECQTPAPVGFHCPECVRESRANAPKGKPAIVTGARRMVRSGAPIVTYSIIAVTALAFVLDLVSGGLVGAYSSYLPRFTAVQPWTMLTAALVHGGIAHFGLNMLSLYIFGRILEPAIGRSRFLALYLLSALGGSLAVLILDPFGGVVGASGAIFGILGAFVVIQRSLGGNVTPLLVLIGLNVVIGFVPGLNISWEAHLGGAVVGAVLALVYSRTRDIRQRRLQIALTAGVGVALIVATAVAYSVIFLR